MTMLSSSYSSQTGTFQAHLAATTTAAPNGVMVDSFQLDGSSTSSDSGFDAKDDLILIEITVIIMSMQFCSKAVQVDNQW